MKASGRGRNESRHALSAGLGALVLVLGLVLPVAADTVTARCDVYAAGEDHTDNSAACQFSQRQGHVTIRLQDGTTHSLSPYGDAPGTYRDEQGRAVYRQSGLGAEGQIYRFPSQSIFVYWRVEPSMPVNEGD